VFFFSFNFVVIYIFYSDMNWLLLLAVILIVAERKSNGLVM